MSDFDIANYMAIDYLENLGIDAPTEEQISAIEILINNVFIKRSLIFNPDLTVIERHCLLLIAHGKTTGMIAGILRVDPQEIKLHEYNIMKKLNCDSLAHCVFEGMRFGYLPSRAV